MAGQDLVCLFSFTSWRHINEMKAVYLYESFILSIHALVKHCVLHEGSNDVKASSALSSFL